MATNTNCNYRIGSVDNRIQKHNLKTNTWNKYDATTGELIACKQNKPFKGVAKDKDNRR